MKKNLIFFACFMIFCSMTKAQIKTIYIQIDSIVCSDSVATLSDFSVNAIKNGYIFIIKGFDYKQTFSFSQHPNYSKVLYLSDDSTYIKLPVFGSYGYICLYNVYNNDIDTILIDKITLNNIPPVVDSVCYSTGFFKIKNGIKDDKPYKTETYTYRIKKSKWQPDDILITINGINYQSSFQLVKDPYISSFFQGDGWRPRNPRDRKGNYKKRLTHIAYESITYESRWIGKIILQNHNKYEKK